MNTSRFVVDTPIGKLLIILENDHLLGIEFHTRATNSELATGPLVVKIQQQLQHYFNGRKRVFDLPLELQGTPFQLKVWQALQAIPYGETRSYGQLAQQLGSSARAVGNACRANPVPLVVPCHRVVAVSGLGGFGGETRGRNIDVKRWLLQHEGNSLSLSA